MTINEAKEQIKYLQLEILKLKQKQKEFQEELIKEVRRIDSLPPFQRFWQKGKLLVSLIDTVIEAIEKAKKQ